MKEKNRLELSKEQKDEMVKAIRHYFSEERDEELGDLAANLILHFITRELGREYYNMGVYDAYRYMGERCEDMLALQL